ncbi:hypothetical protein ABZT02_21840 [Streptomyces sp. NPDC005402]|uniref:hypothetical protein n=1 Tax=Streptomyces sp. NPDC005402 TaxID=3155338 RepID=UPI0033A2B97A
MAGVVTVAGVVTGSGIAVLGGVAVLNGVGLAIGGVFAFLAGFAAGSGFVVVTGLAAVVGFAAESGYAVLADLGLAPYPVLPTNLTLPPAVAVLPGLPLPPDLVIPPDPALLAAPTVTSRRLALTPDPALWPAARPASTAAATFTPTAAVPLPSALAFAFRLVPRSARFGPRRFERVGAGVAARRPGERTGLVAMGVAAVVPGPHGHRLLRQSGLSVIGPRAGSPGAGAPLVAYRPGAPPGYPSSTGRNAQDTGPVRPTSAPAPT